MLPLVGRQTTALARLIERASRALEQAGLESPRREAEALVGGLLGLDRAAIFAHPERPIEAADAERFAQGVTRRAAREPLAYITGEREFWSLPIAVSPQVLIPRPATEHLVEAVLARVRPGDAPRVLDVGTGSGAIVAALAHELPAARFVATDLSQEALAVAALNRARFGLRDRVSLAQGDLFAALDPADVASFDVVVSNPPYVPEASLPRLMAEVRDWEPAGALLGGPDGLAVIRRLVAEASRWLVPGGWLALEHGAEQGSAIASLLSDAGFSDRARIADYEGLDRVAAARWRTREPG